VLLLILVGSSIQAQSVISVKISNLKNPSGRILYSLFHAAEGFPDQPNKAFRRGVVPVSNQLITFDIPAVPPGEYALALIHDLNNNGVLDVNRIGIPIESIGFSNNVMGAFGPPKFQRARFSVRPGKNPIEIRLRMGP
jgi:uncharacterized protein (DUF2141 family)